MPAPRLGLIWYLGLGAGGMLVFFAQLVNLVTVAYSCEEIHCAELSTTHPYFGRFFDPEGHPFAGSYSASFDVLPWEEGRHGPRPVRLQTDSVGRFCFLWPDDNIYLDPNEL